MQVERGNNEVNGQQNDQKEYVRYQYPFAMLFYYQNSKPYLYFSINSNYSLL
jgi:hypothetical protein